MVKQTIALDNQEWNRMIDRFASRITGKATAGKVWNMLLVLPEERRPSVEYVKAAMKDYKW